MSVTVIVGTQWGDEGKGKVTDVLAAQNQYVVRSQGGANAGHTIVVDGTTYKLHHLPSGCLRPNLTSILGHGMVIQTDTLAKELDALPTERGTIVVGQRAHILTPIHQALDARTESQRGAKKIGTTGKGIGPAYKDKVARIGLRVIDLFDASACAQWQERMRAFIPDFDGLNLSMAELDAYLDRGRRTLEPLVQDALQLTHRAYQSGASILLEGAQGALLDLETGTYPYVTSSYPNTAGACMGAGLPPTAVESVVGIVKAYCTRVGSGPFPTELDDAVGQRMRDAGHEYGTTTGRPRRCGWLDLVSLKYSAAINGLTEIALTKADVLNGFETLDIATGYRLSNGDAVDWPPAFHPSNKVEPIYERVEGWQALDADTFENLPASFQRYVSLIESATKARVRWIGTGPQRDELIDRGPASS